MPNIKWVPGQPPPPPRDNKEYLVCLEGEEAAILPYMEVWDNVIAYAPINKPLTINEAVSYDGDSDSWACWDINGFAFHTGLSTREEAEAAYRDEYGDW